MTKPSAPANITIALDPVTRVQDGSTTTHAASGLVSIAGGKAYAVHVVRVHEKVGPRWTRRCVYYHAALSLNGRKVREGAMLEVRDMIVARFKVAMAEMVAMFSRSDQARIAALGLRVTHYGTVDGQFEPMDALAADGSRLIVYRPADSSYGFAGWCPWAAKPFGSHGGRYQTFAGALAWLEAQEA